MHLPEKITLPRNCIRDFCPGNDNFYTSGKEPILHALYTNVLWYNEEKPTKYLPRSYMQETYHRIIFRNWSLTSFREWAKNKEFFNATAYSILQQHYWSANLSKFRGGANLRDMEFTDLMRKFFNSRLFACWTFNLVVWHLCKPSVCSSKLQVDFWWKHDLIYWLAYERNQT